MAEAQETKHEYVVDKPTCIDCNACYTNYPEIFKQVPWEGETKAEAYSTIEAGKYNPWDIIEVCPVEAISKIGDMPEKEDKGDALPELEDLGPWEDRWELAKDKKESRWEIMKRYGMAAVVSEDSKSYTIKIEFPAVAPIHILRFKAGLPDTMPDYTYDIQIDDSKHKITVTGKLEDPHFKKLTGKINSFPDRFKRTFALPEPVEITYKNMRSKILVIKAEKLSAKAAA